MRSVLCESSAESLLASYGEESKLTVGLLIGQIVENGKDFVVHLAKTPHSEQKSEEQEEEEEATAKEELSKVADIKNSLVAEHALNAIRMIVGGFNILGIFVVSESNVLSDNSALQKLKTVLMDVKSTLDSNGILYASTDEYDNGDKLVLNYTTGQKSCICKAVSTDPSKSASASPVDFKFVAKPMDWYEFETVYEVDTAFPLPHTNNHFDTEKHIMATIDDIAANLTKSIMFFNGEPKSLETTVEKFMKEGAGDSSKVNVTIYSEAFQTGLSLDGNNGILKPHESLVHYTGIVASKIYGSPRNTIAEIEKYVRNDIIRSITTRLQIYYDALLANDDGGNLEENEDQDVNSTIPPRRVFFPIANSNSVIKFCDYLFQNENEDTTVKQSRDILGVDLKETDVDISSEAVAQLKIPEKSDAGSANDEMTALSSNDSGKLILVLGIIGLVIALIVSVALHLFLK